MSSKTLSRNFHGKFHYLFPMLPVFQSAVVFSEKHKKSICYLKTLIEDQQTLNRFIYLVEFVFSNCLSLKNKAENYKIQ